jgi:hypothetical protein
MVALAQRSAEAINSDELAVYAAILDSPENFSEDSRILIADKTSTFACGETTENGLSVGGCNGLRGSSETPSERMAIVLKDITGLKKDTVDEFVRTNQKCVSITRNIPSKMDYYLFNDPGIPKSWKYSFLVYFSRVGFNSEHIEALVNVGSFSSVDAKLSEGHYVVLHNLAGKWALGESSAVWKLRPSQ